MSVMTTLDVAGLPVLIVGGGGVATRRGAALTEQGAVLTVVAPSIDEALSAAAEKSRGAAHRRAYRSADLTGCRLVIAATDDASVNAQVAEDAASAGVWCNCASEPSRGRVGFVAERRIGQVRVGVETGGVSAAAAREIADTLATSLEGSDWARLLDEAKRWRGRVQDAIEPGKRRQAALRELTGPAARRRLAEGGAEALNAYYEGVLADASGPTVSRGGAT
ncbi:MAG: bifunctional precorrin-2 dehydrogenase/sirohydrochlorin ferrochelatase [Planctomycetota bacterium]